MSHRLIVAIVGGVLCLAGCRSDPAANDGAKKPPARPGGGSGSPAAGSGSGSAAAPTPVTAYRDGLSVEMPAKYAGHKPWATLVGRFDEARANAHRKVAARIGLVVDDAPGRRRAYYRFASASPQAASAAAPEVAFGRTEPEIVDGDTRPVVELHPEAMLAGQVSLDEAVAFEAARAALMTRTTGRYHDLPAWFVLGAAYHVAERTDTLIDRVLAAQAYGSRAPRDLVRAPTSSPPPGPADQALWGALFFAYVESNRGTGAVKDVVAAITRTESPASLDEACRHHLGRGMSELDEEVLRYGQELLAERSSRLLVELRAAIDDSFLAAKYPAAIHQLSVVRDASPHGYAAGVALYFIGRSQYALERYDLAHEAFAGVIANHARTAPDLDLAMFWDARCRIQQRRGQDAVALLEGLCRDFPASATRPEALLLLGGTWVELGDDARAEAALVARLEGAAVDTGATDARLALARIARRRYALARARLWLEPLGARAAELPAAQAKPLAELLAELATTERAELPADREQRVVELARAMADPAAAPSARGELCDVGPAAAAAIGRQLATAKNPTQRAGLVDVLAVLADARGAPYLVAELERPDAVERSRALRALLRLGSSPELLVAQVDASALPAPRRADIAREIQVLTMGSTPALRALLPDLLVQLSHPDAAERLRGVRSLNTLQNTDGVPVLARVLAADPDAGVRREAIDGLAVWGDARAAEGFVAATRDTDPYVRGVALQQLVRHGHAPGLPAAIACLKDANGAVRAAAFRAVALLGGVEQLDRLLAGTTDPDDEVHRAATEGLLALAARTPRDRRQLVRDLIPRIERTADRAGQLRLMYLLSQLTGLDLKAFPGIEESELVRRLDRARLWLARGS